MTIVARRFLFAKHGHSPDQCDDALACDVSLGRFAASDGASEGAFNGLWARTLVEEFVAQGSAEVERLGDWLAGAQRKWVASLAGVDVPWHAEAAVQKGAFATFLGATIERDGAGYLWRAAAIGDSCLFHTRGDELLAAFPIERSESFSTRPTLIGSRTPVGEASHQRATSAQGSALPGDRLWLATDALAHWFLCEHEMGGRPPVAELTNRLASGDGAAAGWLGALRAESRLRNDDVALLAIEL